MRDSTSHARQADDDDLQRFGYRQKLERSIGAFSSFALAFSLISVTTGVFANFAHGLRTAGPAMLWTWLLVACGQFLVALVLAELSTAYPLAGYGYQWTSRLVNPHFGFFVGWLLVCQFLTGFPGVCNALAAPLLQAITGREAPPAVVASATVWIISIIALIHLFGIRWAARINDWGVIAEIAGCVVITFTLLLRFGLGRPHGVAILADATTSTGTPATWSGLALSLLVGAWCLTGFEAAADLAEETRQPRTIVPRAILTSQLSAAIAGFLLLMAFLLAIDDRAAIDASANPLLEIMRRSLGDIGLRFALAVVFVSIFACGVASMAAATRLLYSLARDNMLPISHFLQRVHPTRHTPNNAILTVWLLSSIVVLQLQNLALITSISVVAGYLGYAGIILASLWAPASTITSSRLSRLRRPIAAIALAWTAIVVLALTVPEIDGGRLNAQATAAATVVGGCVYAAVIRARLLRGEAGPPATSEPRDHYKSHEEGNL